MALTTLSEHMTGRITPGWYPDPHTPGIQRWHNGTTWDSHLRPSPPQRPAPEPARGIGPDDLVDPQSAQHLLLDDPHAQAGGPKPKRNITPGWYADPVRSGDWRWHSGKDWTFHTRAAKPKHVHRPPRRAVPRWARKQLADLGATTNTLSTRSRSVTATGLVGLALAAGAFGFGGYILWNTTGTNLAAAADQNQLRAELASIAADDPRFTNLDNMPGSATGDVSVSSTPPVADTDTLDEGVDTAATAEGVDSTTEVGVGLAGAWSGNDNPTFDGTEVGNVAVKQNVHTDITPWPPSGWVAPEGRSIPTLPNKTAAPWARIRVPALGLDTVVVTGTGEKSLRKGPGVWKAGAVPGSPGNATIAAHRTTYGAAFRNIHKLAYGDNIIVDIPGQPRAVYEVRGRAIVTPTNLKVTKKTPGVRLTLLSCHPMNSDRFRMAVQAEMVSGAWLDKSVNRSPWRLSV